MTSTSRRLRFVPWLIALGGCALGGGDDDVDRVGGGTCVQAGDCGGAEICNLVTQRCAPRNAAAPNQVRADFECTFDSGGNGGPAYYSWNHAGQQEDFGALCFGSRIAPDYVTLFLFGGDSTYAVTVELDPSKGAGDYPTPVESLVYVDRRGDDASSFAYGISGTVQLERVDADGLRGSLVVGLDRAYAVGESCEAASARCGSAGVGVFCNRQDPSGVATCRRSCYGGRPCPADEVCASNADGFDLCVPAMGQLDSRCEVQEDCREGTCIKGQLGAVDQGFCRSSCEPEGADWCGSGPHICADLMGGGGACIPNPCALGTCESGACRPTGLFEAECVAATEISGTFDVRITAGGASLRGTASFSGAMPGGGPISATGVAGAVLGTEGSTVEILLGASSDRVIVLQLPVGMAFPLAAGEDVRVYVPVWEVGAGVLDISSSETVTLAVVTSGGVAVTSVGATEGAKVMGAFELWFTEATR